MKRKHDQGRSIVGAKNGLTAPGATAHNQESAHSVTSRTGSTKVLVVYYSLTGTTKRVAEMIREKTGGDVFEIETVKDYPASYSEIIEIAKRELETGELPVLKQPPPRYVIL